MQEKAYAVREQPFLKSRTEMAEMSRRQADCGRLEQCGPGIERAGFRDGVAFADLADSAAARRDRGAPANAA